ncbi:MAG: hypothetical protein IJY94_01940 [Clostridia bacterium]|nr:hypothetical protein [Clostridia bacterium]
MESFKKFVKTTLYPACLIFTALIFAVSLLYELMDFNRSFALTPIALIQFFVFSLILCWSKDIFNDEKMSFATSHFLHYVIFLFNVMISFIFIGQRGNFIGTLVAFSLLYLIGALIALIVRKTTKKKTSSKSSSYKKQFK